MSGIPHSLRILPVDAEALFLDHDVSPDGEVAVEGLGGGDGDEGEGEGLADAAHAVDGALAFDDDGAFGGEVLAESAEHEKCGPLWPAFRGVDSAGSDNR
jgi:hypothetical protein